MEKLFRWWRRLFFIALTVMAVVMVTGLITADRILDHVDDLRALDAERESLSSRFHTEAATRVSELHTLLLRAVTSREPADHDAWTLAKGRVEKHFAERPPDLNAVESAACDEVLDDARLYFERAAMLLALPPDKSADARRLDGVLELDPARSEWLKDINALGDLRARSLQDGLDQFAGRLHFMQWLFGLSVAAVLAVMGLLVWCIRRGWIAPLLEKAAEAERLAQQQQHLADLGTLAAGLAHEIRNPIGALKNRAFALSLMLESESKEGRQIAAMDAEMNRVERIVRDFLDNARPVPPNPQPGSLRQFVESAAGDFRSEVERRSAVLQTETATDSMVGLDAAQMRQVLLNLMVNAADSCGGKEGGSVIITTAVADDRAIISVQDNGTGVPAENRRRIFEPFFTGKSGGTGLGLAISQEIVRRHAGELTLRESKPGEGAVFEILLPL